MAKHISYGCTCFSNESEYAINEELEKFLNPDNKSQKIIPISISRTTEVSPRPVGRNYFTTSIMHHLMMVYETVIEDNEESVATA